MASQARSILWVSGSPQEGEFGFRVSEKMARAGFRTVFLTDFSATYERFKSLGASVVFLREAAQPYDRSPTPDDLAELDRRYSDPGLNRIRCSDGTLRPLPPADAFRVLAARYRACEALFQQEQVAAVVLYPTAMHPGRIPYSMAKSRHLPALLLQWGPLRKNTYVLEDMGEDWMWSSLLSKEPVPLPADEIERTLRSVVDENRGTTHPGRPLWREVLGYLRETFRSSCGMNGGFDYDRALAAFEREKVKRSLRRRLARGFFPYERPCFDEPFIFFALHAHYDAALVSANAPYENQVEVAAQIARNLPPGIRLYVKEHPYDIGYLSRTGVKALLRIGNVSIIDPAVKSVELIEKSQAVAVISGSAGWEAMCLKKPVVVLGKPFYAFSEIAYAVEDFRSLRPILREALSRGSRIYSERREEYLRFCARVLATARPGNSQGYKSNFGWPGDTAEKNYEQIAGGIAERLAAAGSPALTQA